MRRRRTDAGIRRELIELEEILLGLMVGVGADSDVAITRAHIADLKSGRSVTVRASDVGRPQDVGWVILEADGSITRLPEDLTSAGQR